MGKIDFSFFQYYGLFYFILFFTFSVDKEKSCCGCEPQCGGFQGQLQRPLQPQFSTMSGISIVYLVEWNYQSVTQQCMVQS